MKSADTTVDVVNLPERLASIRLHDEAGQTALAQALPKVRLLIQDPSALEAVLTLCEGVAIDAPGQLEFLAGSLAYLLEHLDVLGLQRWILTGTRLYGADDARLNAYFALDDSAAVGSLHAEMKGTSLSTIQPSLPYFLTGFGIDSMEVKARKQLALHALSVRPVISDQVLLLPEHYLALDGALGKASSGAIYIAAAAHAIAHLKFSPLHRPSNKRKPLLLTVLSLIEDARVERMMGQIYPGLYALWGSFHNESGVTNALTFASLTARLARALHDPTYEDPNHWVNKGRTLFESCADRLNDLAAFNEVGSILANDLGQMRVQFVPQLYLTRPAYRDDNSVLWEFDSENQEVADDEVLARNAEHVVDNDDDAEKAARFSPITPLNEQRVMYAEWDYQSESLRENWVSVIDIPPPRSVHTVNDGIMQGAARRIAPRAKLQQLDRAVRLRQQYDGEELDIDAAIDCRISYRGRVTPNPRIFQRTGKRRRHLKVVLLLDLSESTNDRVGGSYTSVLDLEKQAASILTNVIDPTYDQIAISGFASNGRSEVRYWHIKQFDEPFGDVQRRYLRDQQGALSTRMGAALRHAGTQFAAGHAEKKILLVITDGEPSDIDVVDNLYLVEDARHAVASLARKGIDTFCMTLDQRADSYVRTIFGAWNFQIVDDATSLPFQVTRAFEKIAAR